MGELPGIELGQMPRLVAEDSRKRRVAVDVADIRADDEDGLRRVFQNGKQQRLALFEARTAAGEEMILGHGRAR